VIVVLLVSLVLVATTACLVAATAKPLSLVSFVLGAYLVAWGELVGVVFVLSIFHAVRAWTLATALAAGLVAAVACWRAMDAPRPPPIAPRLRRAALALRDPPLAILGLVAALAILYAVVLGTATPQNDWDSLGYHLTRAALWVQQGFVGYVPHTTDPRINGNPPNTEIGLLAVLLLGGDDRLTWLPQLTAALAGALAVFGIGRRVGWDVRGALFGALCFVSLPVIALQMSSALNDLVVAAFFTTAVYFALGTGRRAGAAAALALALGCGSKISAPLLLVVFGLVVLAGRRRPLLENGAIVAAGIAGGSAWYVLNLIHTGALDGGLAQEANQIPGRGPVLIAWRAVRLVLNGLELPGAAGRDAYLYGVCAVALLVTAGFAYRRGAGGHGALIGAAIAVVVIPVAVWLTGDLATQGWHRWWQLVGRDDIASTIPAYKRPVLTDSTATWFGPVGVALVLAGMVCAARAKGRGRLLGLALAASPVAFILIAAAGLTYDPWRGRFFVFPVALAAATWGAVYRIRLLAWATAGLVATTTVLVLAHSFGKPPGVRLLDDRVPPSVFGQPRWKVETWIRTSDGTGTTIRYVDNHVPGDATVGLALRVNDFVFPYFGRTLGREIQLLPAAMPAGAELQWIVEAPGRTVPRCSASWHTVLDTTDGFRILRRTGADRCRLAAGTSRH
jgi:hypothetical protein